MSKSDDDRGRGVGAGVVGVIFTTVIGAGVSKAVQAVSNHRQVVHDLTARGSTLIGACRDWTVNYRQSGAVAEHHKAHAEFKVVVGQAQRARRSRERAALAALTSGAASMVQAVDQIDQTNGTGDVTVARQAIDTFESRLDRLSQHGLRQFARLDQAVAD